MKHYAIHAFTALIIASLALPIYAQEPIHWNLKQCIDYAIENNLSLKKADNQIQQDKLNKQTKQWSRLPSVDANASQGWNWGRSPSPIDNRYSNVRSANTNFGLSTNLPLFTGLELPNQYALSKIQLKASLADLAKAKEDLSIQVTNSYIQVLFNQE
ncbi:MAG: TolC family protein, partial [Bacteroides sp.]